MTILKTDFSELKKLVGRNFTIEELNDILFDFGMELDSYEGNDLYIDITADRPDLLSSFTLATELKKYLGLTKEKEIEKTKINKSEIKIFVDKKVNAVRPYIAAFVAKNLHIDDLLLKEIINVQEKLHETFCRNRKIAAIGIYPLDKINAPIYYTTESPNEISFKPLNAEKIMNAVEILEKHDTGIKYASLLKDKAEYPLLLDSKNNILSMPPIINSADIGRVEKNTKEIFIEVTGTVKSRVEQLIKILTKLFIDVGADIYSVEIKYNNNSIITPDITERKLIVYYNYIKEILDLSIESGKLKELLAKMGYKTNSIYNDKIEINVPYYRADILHPIDVIDDIARAYKFNNFKPEIPKLSTVGGFLPKTKIIRFIREIFIGMGFSEAFTFSLTNKKYQYQYMNIDSKEWINIPNAKAGEINAVRTWIIPELLKTTKANEDFGLPIKLFELNDSCIVDERTETGYRNVPKLAVLIMDQKVTFTNIKQALDMIMKTASQSTIKYELEECTHGSFIDGRVGNIIIKKDKIKKNFGIIGEISPIVLENFNLKYPIAAFEFDISALIENE
ncbi:MAG: phenylalanine--tRNA ligase subunit beta [Candidatus Micrarchaeia archaeon]